MKYAYLLALLFCFTSCDYFDVKKTSSEDILNEELKTFSWNELDVYPTFSVCDASLTKTEKKACFENTLTTEITNFLSTQHLVVSHTINDTIALTFTISDQGKASIIDIKVKEETLSELPDIKNILLKSIDSLPKIFPAIKRGQQVTSQFKLPIVIQVE